MGIFGGEDDRLPAVLPQVFGDLQATQYADASARRPVVGNDKDSFSVHGAKVRQDLRDLQDLPCEIVMTGLWKVHRMNSIGIHRAVVCSAALATSLSRRDS